MDPELKLRGELAEALKGMWLMTWHEDREINPGVPDVSFVMLRGDYETGWMELKAINTLAPPFKWTMERSQHEWISHHHKVVPVTIFIATPDYCWLIPGSHHGLFHSSFKSREALNEVAICHFPREALRASLYPHLRNITDRGRSNGSI